MFPFEAEVGRVGERYSLYPIGDIKHSVAMLPGIWHRTMINERVFRNFCDAVDVDEEFLEILIDYVDRLVAIGIDFSYGPLQEAIEGNISNLESACQSFIGYAG